MQALVAEQVAYYRAHAPDYDVACLGRDWDRCIEELPIAGDVLELACGTGHGTPLLAARARSVTALDAAPEALALARRRVQGPPVEFIEADVFAWEPSRRFDTVFFAFWLTHVPSTRFAAFWSMVGRALAGWVGLLHRRPRPGTGQRTIRAGPGGPGGLAPLRDGSEHRVVKVYYAPDELTARLAELGWSAEIRETSTPLLVGTARRTSGR